MEYRAASFMVQPNIGMLNRIAQQAKKVAITSVSPVFDGYTPSTDEHPCQTLQALRIQVEGPSQHMAYFNKLIEKNQFQILA